MDRSPRTQSSSGLPVLLRAKGVVMEHRMALKVGFKEVALGTYELEKEVSEDELVAWSDNEMIYHPAEGKPKGVEVDGTTLDIGDKSPSYFWVGEIVEWDGDKEETPDRAKVKSE